MGNEIVIREYRMPDAELTAFTQIVCDNITRDIAEFSAYNVLAADVTALQALCDAFEIFPSDDFYNMEFQNATENKDNLIEEMRVLVRSLALRAELKWGKKSPFYKNLGISDMVKLNDDSYISRCRKIHNFLTEYLSDLLSVGLTQLMLDDFDDKIQILDDAMRDQENKNIERAIKAVERVKNGNAIYDLVSKYCEIGKVIWNGVNSAKYNSYIIYSSQSPGSLTAPEGLSFFWATTTFSWNEVENATSYRLMASLNNLDWFEVFAGESLECVYVPIQTGTMFYKVQARSSAGFGPFSTVLSQGYYPGTVLPAPENLTLQLAAGSPNTLELKWSPVSSATTYSVNKSSVPLGSPVGTFSFITNTHDPEYVETVLPGHRYYFNLTASNSNQWSGVSVNVFLDVPE